MPNFGLIPPAATNRSLFRTVLRYWGGLPRDDRRDAR